MSYYEYVTTRRQYEDSCGAAQGLNIVGERWALLVVRELLLGPKRFARLRGDLPGISPNVLSQRLTELESAGVLHRRRLAPPADVWVYELTEWGAALEPVIIQLGRWAASSPFFDREHGLSVASAVLSQRTMFQPEAAAGERLSIVLRLGDQRFWAKVGDGQFSIEPGDTTEPDATVTTGPVVLASVLYGGRDLTEAIEAQELEIEGDTRALERYLTMFWLPPVASMPTIEEIRDMETTQGQ